jgi:hypothetical protein
MADRDVATSTTTTTTTTMTASEARRAEAARTARMILQTMVTLATGSLGFVAALAWNDAISTTIKQIMGESEGLAGLYIYAVIATLIAIALVLMLARLASRIGGEAAITREVD